MQASREHYNEGMQLLENDRFNEARKSFTAFVDSVESLANPDDEDLFVRDNALFRIKDCYLGLERIEDCAVYVRDRSEKFITPDSKQFIISVVHELFPKTENAAVAIPLYTRLLDQPFRTIRSTNDNITYFNAGLAFCRESALKDVRRGAIFFSMAYLTDPSDSEAKRYLDELTSFGWEIRDNVRIHSALQAFEWGVRDDTKIGILVDDIIRSVQNTLSWHNLRSATIPDTENSKWIKTCMDRAWDYLKDERKTSLEVCIENCDKSLSHLDVAFIHHIKGFALVLKAVSGIHVNRADLSEGLRVLSIVRSKEPLYDYSAFRKVHLE